MATLRFDAGQRFTCQQCGRCCRRGWDIALTPAEVAAYRKGGVARWFRESEDGSEGAETDPFEPIPTHPEYSRIRKRLDGACGFLSPDNRCRIHEEMGADKKPLACRLFPFRFHPADGPAVLTASFSCPTVVANEGAPLTAQVRELSDLRKEWFRAYPEPTVPLSFVAGRSLSGAALGTLRSVLRDMLDRPGTGGSLDLRANVGRMARTLEDLSRYRVVRLADEAFEEYLELTGRYAAGSEKPLPPRPPSAVGRLLFRGFAFLVLAAQLQMEDGRGSGLRLGLRLRVLRLLAHFQGLAPGVGGIDLDAARRVRIDVQDPGVHAIVYNYVRSGIEALGTGRRPVLEELAVAFSFVNAASLLAAIRAGAAGVDAVDARVFTETLMSAMDLTHAETTGTTGRLLRSLSGGVESLYHFASGRLL